MVAGALKQRTRNRGRGRGCAVAVEVAVEVPVVELSVTVPKDAIGPSERRVIIRRVNEYYHAVSPMVLISCGRKYCSLVTPFDYTTNPAITMSVFVNGTLKRIVPCKSPIGCNAVGRVVYISHGGRGALVMFVGLCDTESFKEIVVIFLLLLMHSTHVLDV